MSSKIKTFDFILFLIPLLFVLVSIAVIFSLVYNTFESNLIIKQIISAAIGLACMVLIGFADYRFLRSISWLIYLVTLLLLVYVDLFGKAAGGAMRWIDLGFYQIQPSELAKIGTIIILATFFSKRYNQISWRDIFLSGFMLLPAILLILKEPDMGTALVIIFIYFVMLFFAKLKKIQVALIAIVLTVIVSTFILSVYKVKPFESLMQDYQRNRITTFLNPSLDPYGKGYNARQAQIAVGSGGVLGKGLGRGSQSQLQFLPKPYTDFIFAGIAESFGFLGAAIILSLMAFLIIKILAIGNMAQDHFGMFIAIGTAATFLFQVIINVGMNIGIAPVTGIPLPFLSYGGSALISYLFLVGITQSIFIRHRKLTF